MASLETLRQLKQKIAENEAKAKREEAWCAAKRSEIEADKSRIEAKERELAQTEKLVEALG